MQFHRNVAIWYITTFFSYAAFTLPIWVIFNTQVLGLTNTQAFILGVLPFGLSAFFEVPTGSWADRYGRARIYQIGTLLYILSVASFVFVTDFYVLLALQVVGGLGLAMQSGGIEALVHDSLPEKDKDKLYAKIHAKKMAILFSSRVITVLLSGLLFSVNPRAPFVVATVTYVLGLAVSLFFKEVRVETPNALSHIAHIGETAKMLVRTPGVSSFLALVTIYTICSEALFAIYQPYFKSIHIEIGEFGLFYAVISLLSAVGALGVATLMRRLGVLRVLLCMMCAVLFTLSLMLSHSPLLTFVAIVPSSLGFGFIVTITNTVIQRHIRSRHQATALSIASLLRSIAILVSVVGVGVLLDVISVSLVTTVLTLTTLVSVIPFVFSLIRSNTQQKSKQ